MKISDFSFCNSLSVSGTGVLAKEYVGVLGSNVNLHKRQIND